MGHRRHEDVMRAYKELGIGSPEDFGWGSGDTYRRGGPDWDPQGFGDQYKRLDKFGFSNTLPEEHIAPEVQYMAERQAAHRNDRLMAQSQERGRGLFDAGQGALNQGLETMQAYRPGGAAAMTSPYYTGKASMYAQQADWDLRGSAARRQEAPNLMFRFDERYRKKARKDAREAGAVQIGGMILGAAANVLGSGLGGGGTAGATGPGGGTGSQQLANMPQAPGGLLTAGGGGGGVQPPPPESPMPPPPNLPAGGTAPPPTEGATGGGQYSTGAGFAGGGGGDGGEGGPPSEGGGAGGAAGGAAAPAGAPPLAMTREGPAGTSQAGPTAQALSARTGIAQTTLDAHLWALDNPEDQPTFVENMTDRLEIMAGHQQQYGEVA